jgi:RNA polymerase sigma-70 factor (ECF subfamily)
MATTEPGDLVDLVDERSASVALEAFVAEHYGRLIRLAGLVCRSIDDAEDAVQAALERAWRRRMQLQDGALIRPWLDRIVVREAIRRNARRLPTMSELPVAAARSAATDDWMALRMAFDQLSVDQRAAIVLHLYMGYSVSATAQLLGVPVETARSRLRLGRSRLRALLAVGG